MSISLFTFEYYTKKEFSVVVFLFLKKESRLKPVTCEISLHSLFIRSFSIPFPNPRLANIASTVLSVDQELKQDLVQRETMVKDNSLIM